MAGKSRGGGGSIIGTIIAAVLTLAFLSSIGILQLRPLPTPTPEQPVTVETPTPEPTPETEIPFESGNEITINNSGEIPLTVPAGLKQAQLMEMLNQLEEKPIVTETYSRDYFKHWVDADSNGCTARAEVLIIESTTSTTRSGTCTIETGTWISTYDNITITDAGTVDIDHMVPLNEAWKSGANAWTAAQRETYANDLGYPGSLIGVTAASNRSKSDKDPALWMPTNEAYHCTYTATWVTVKWRWKLAVDQAEKAKVYQVLNKCTDEQIQLPTK